jgi:hypothetical protein
MKDPCTSCCDTQEDGFSWEECNQGERPGETASEKESSLMADQAHLAAAKKALSDGYKLDSDPLKTVWGRVADAKRHLDAIKPESALYGAAKSLRRETLSREKHMEHLRIALTNQIMMKQREMVASELEHLYVERGIFVDVELSGPEKMFIRFGCSLFREASVERIADETSLFVHLRKAGFKRVVFGDNYETNWTYSLQRS